MGRGLALSPDERWLVTPERVCDLKTGRWRTYALDFPATPVEWLAFTPDGRELHVKRRLLEDGQYRALVDVHEVRENGPDRGVSEEVECLVVGTTRVLEGSRRKDPWDPEERDLRIRNRETGRIELLCATNYYDGNWLGTFSRSEERLVFLPYGRSFEMMVLDVPSRQVHRVRPSGYGDVRDVCFAPDEDLISFLHERRFVEPGRVRYEVQLELFDWRREETLASVRVPDGELLECEVAPDGRTLLVHYAAGMVQLVDLRQQDRFRQVALPGNRIMLSRDGDRVYVADDVTERLTVLPFEELRERSAV